MTAAVSAMDDVMMNMDKYLHTFYPDTPMAHTQVSNQIGTNTHSNDTPKQKLSMRNTTKSVPEDMELYKNQEDLLTQIQLQYDKKTNLTTINFTTKQKHTAILTADATLYQQILFSIKRAIPLYKWGISF